MQTFLLSCDLSTMKCTVEDINAILTSFASDHIQVNTSLWFFKYDESKACSPLRKEEHLFCTYFEQLTNKDSIIFIEKLTDKHYYNLPDIFHDFLVQD